MLSSLCGVLHAPLLHVALARVYPARGVLALLRLDFCERDAEGKRPIPTKVR